MSAPALAERSRARFLDTPRMLDSTDVRRPFEGSGGGRLTLEQMLDCVWEGLRADGVAACPLCRGRMTGGTDGASCGDCGTSVR